MTARSPASAWVSKVNPRFKTPVNALLVGAVDHGAVRAARLSTSPGQDIHIWFITYPANINALVSLVSFGVSGIYLSFLLTVIGAIVARARGWVPEGSFRLGRWALARADHRGGLPRPDAGQRRCTDGPEQPARLLQPRLDHAAVMFVIALVGAVYFSSPGPTGASSEHLHDALEPTGAESHGSEYPQPS